jgi:hypothetical protein
MQRISFRNFVACGTVTTCKALGEMHWGALARKGSNAASIFPIVVA